MLNSPKQIEAEKIRMAQKEKEKAEKEKEKEKEGKAPSKANSINGTGGTPIHVNTLQVRKVKRSTPKMKCRFCHNNAIELKAACVARFVGKFRIM